MLNLERWILMDVTDYLKKIESIGYECYIVGGFVRDFLLGKTSYDIDIATNAQPEKIITIFKDAKVDLCGCVKLIGGCYTVDITTYRKEKSYKNRRPEKVEYIDDIREDLMRRDFTINAICMDSKKVIYDPLNGQKDLQNKVIRVIKDVEESFTEDPLRILRAIRFSVELSFEIEKPALEFITSHGHLLRELSLEKRKEELTKIFSVKDANRALKMLKELCLLEHLSLTYDNDMILPTDPLGIWTIVDLSRVYHYSREEKKRIESIQNIVNSKFIDSYTVLNYDLEDILIAAEILNIDKEKVLDLFSRNTLHKKEDLAIDGNEIKKILGIESGKMIKDIKECLLNEVINGNLTNEKKILIEYIEKNWK